MYTVENLRKVNPLYCLNLKMKVFRELLEDALEIRILESIRGKC